MKFEVQTEEENVKKTFFVSSENRYFSAVVSRQDHMQNAVAIELCLLLNTFCLVDRLTCPACRSISLSEIIKMCFGNYFHILPSQFLYFQISHTLTFHNNSRKPHTLKGKKSTRKLGC